MNMDMNMDMNKQEINNKFNELMEKYNKLICMCDTDFVTIEGIKSLKAELLRAFSDYAWYCIDGYSIREILVFHTKIIQDINFNLCSN